jgi:hypothetical protein
VSVNIPPEIRRILGIPNDASAFAVAMFRSFFSPLRAIHNRVVERMRVDVVEIEDVDPLKAGKQRARITMRERGSNPGHLGARVAVMVVQKNAGPIYIDEARRWLTGQPIGTSRRLDDDEELAPIPGVDRRLQAARTFDPVTLTLIVGVAVPILVAVIPVVLPMLIELGRSAFSVITDTPSGPAVKGSAVPASDKEFGPGAVVTGPLLDVLGVVGITEGDGDPTNDLMNVLIVAGVAVLVVYLWRSR